MEGHGSSAVPLRLTLDYPPIGPNYAVRMRGEDARPHR